MLVFLLWWT